jgi:peptidyl-prolyl cis-trans isomerase D
MGRTLRAQLEARVKAGDSFEKAAAAVTGPVKLSVKEYPAFVRRQPPKELDQPALAALESLDQGQVSDLRMAADKGYFVFVREKKNPDLSETSPQFKSTQAQIAQLTANLGGNLVLGEVVAEELKKNAAAAR